MAFWTDIRRRVTEATALVGAAKGLLLVLIGITAAFVATLEAGGFARQRALEQQEKRVEKVEETYVTRDTFSEQSQAMQKLLDSQDKRIFLLEEMRKDEVARDQLRDRQLFEIARSIPGARTVPELLEPAPTPP